MTGRTHDLTAVTLLNIYVVTHTVPAISVATSVAAIAACCMGALAPDIDQPTADLWNRLPAGNIIGKLLAPLLGGHRFISHSLAGAMLFGYLAKFLFGLLGKIILVDMTVVWSAFMIGFISHLLIDTITREGVPWLFPLSWKIGFPPFRFMRVKTGGIVEKFIIFPGFILLNGYLFYSHHAYYVTLLRRILSHTAAS
jgi:inner membrane protein